LFGFLRDGACPSDNKRITYLQWNTCQPTSKHLGVMWMSEFNYV